MNRRRTRIRRWFRKKLPNWLFIYDFEIFTALLCLLAGVPLLFGRVDPTSLEAALPAALVTVWGAILSIGPLAMLAGIYMSQKAETEDQIFWQRVEAWGLSALAYASYIYAGTIMINLSRSGWVASLLVISFGFTCHIREIDIQLRITEVRYRLGLS